MITKPKLPLIQRGHPLARGLVGAWVMYEGAGNVVRDLAMRRDATLRGDAAWDQVIHNRSIAFDGNGDYLSAGNSSKYAFGSGNFAFSARVRLSTTSGMRAILGKDVAGGRQFILLANVTSAGQLQISYFIGSSEVLLRSNSFFTAGVTTDIVAQRRGNTFDIYKDGVLRSSGTSSGSHGTMSSTSTELRIGARQYSSYNNWWYGSIGYVFIHNRALTRSEAMSLHIDPYQMFRRPSGPRGLVASVQGAAATTTIRLAWQDNSEGEDGFQIERRTGAGAYGVIHTTAAGVTTWDNTGVPLGATYTYRVRATSEALGDSEYSNEASVTV